MSARTRAAYVIWRLLGGRGGWPAFWASGADAALRQGARAEKARAASGGRARSPARAAPVPSTTPGGPGPHRSSQGLTAVWYVYAGIISGAFTGSGIATHAWGLAAAGAISAGVTALAATR